MIDDKDIKVLEEELYGFCTAISKKSQNRIAKARRKYE